MSIDEHDNRTLYCRTLGHEVPFFYCRRGVSSLPCRKVFDCWHETFDIVAFMRGHYTEEQLAAIVAPAKPKMASLIEMIEQARKMAGPDKQEG